MGSTIQIKTALVAVLATPSLNGFNPMALAIKLDGLVRSGQAKDYAELARLARVSRARITPIMNLTCLSPEFQEALLFLAKDEMGKRVRLRPLQSVAATLNWNVQSNEVLTTANRYPTGITQKFFIPWLSRLRQSGKFKRISQ